MICTLRNLTLTGLVALNGCTLWPNAAGPQVDFGKAVPVMRFSGAIDNVSATYAKARDYLLAGRLNEAIRDFNLVLAAQPEHPDAMNALAVAYAQMGQIDAAVRLFEKAIARSANAGSIYNNLGYALLKAGRLESAKVALEAGLSLEPGNVAVAVNLANLKEIRVANGVSAATRSVGSTSSVEPAASSGSSSASTTLASQTSSLQIAGYEQVTGSRERLTQVAPNLFELRSEERPEIPTAMAKSGVDAQALVLASTLILSQAPSPSAKESPMVLGAEKPTIRSTRLAIRSALKGAKVTVLNANGTRGLAQRYAKWLRTQGVTVPGVRNFKDFEQQQTRIEFVGGAEATAGALSALLSLVPSRLVVGSSSTTEIRLVLGRDHRARALITALEQEDKGDVVYADLERILVARSD